MNSGYILVIAKGLKGGDWIREVKAGGSRLCSRGEPFKIAHCRRSAEYTDLSWMWV